LTFSIAYLKQRNALIKVMILLLLMKMNISFVVYFNVFAFFQIVDDIQSFGFEIVAWKKDESLGSDLLLFKSTSAEEDVSTHSAVEVSRHEFGWMDKLKVKRH